jgi:hypothetical protein
MATALAMKYVQRSAFDQSITRFWLMLILLAAAGGCSQKDFATASGMVRFSDGSPIVGGVKVVRFEPVKTSENDFRKPAFSHIGEDGGFTMMTRQPGDGVETGRYAVTFTVLNSQQAARSLIPSRYNVPRTTPFQVTVDADKNDWLFELDKNYRFDDMRPCVILSAAERH